MKFVEAYIQDIFFLNSGRNKCSDGSQNKFQYFSLRCFRFPEDYFAWLYKVVQIWPGQTVTCLHTNRPGHIWTTLYEGCQALPAHCSDNGNMKVKISLRHSWTTYSLRDHKHCSVAALKHTNWNPTPSDLQWGKGSFGLVPEMLLITSVGAHYNRNKICEESVSSDICRRSYVAAVMTWTIVFYVVVLDAGKAFWIKKFFSPGFRTKSQY